MSTQTMAARTKPWLAFSVPVSLPPPPERPVPHLPGTQRSGDGAASTPSVTTPQPTTTTSPSLRSAVTGRGWSGRFDAAGHHGRHDSEQLNALTRTSRRIRHSPETRSRRCSWPPIIAERRSGSLEGSSDARVGRPATGTRHLRDSGLTEVHYFSLARIHKALVDMGATPS